MRNDSDNIIREQVNRLGIPPQEMLQKEILRHDRNEAYRKLIRGGLIGLITITALVLVITNLWLAVLQIEGSSMNPLLQRDEIVIAVRNDNPEKNDIIAFYFNNKLHIKRVIATAGEWVDIDSDGVVSVNGKILDEPYVAEPSLGNCDIDFPFFIPTGTVFVMGDNRPVSLDSRDNHFGPITRDQIVGKIKYSIWPLSQFGSI
ncbi:MAG: signal peptidase I [Oscillospiraceae bacterium]|nr:signal peptidase I [Oscillospiraceae bacterium]